MSARRSCSTASPWVRPTPAEMTRSGSSATICSMSTPSNLATIGTSAASGGKLATSSTLPTTRSPAPIVNRISVVAGVSETIFWGSAAIVTSVPSSSVRVTGKLGAGVGDGASGCRRAGRRGRCRRGCGRGLTAGRAGGDEQGDQDSGNQEALGSHGSLRRGSGSGARERAAGRVEARHGTSGKGCLSRSVASRCLPFLSKVEQPLRVGDRTSIWPGGRAIDGHRSGTVPDSHRLRGPAACRLETAREA